MSRQAKLVLQIFVVVIFFFIGLLFAAPCLCYVGSVKAVVKFPFFVIVLIRLIFGIYRNNLKYYDYLLWIGAYLAFCIAIDSF